MLIYKLVSISLLLYYYNSFALRVSIIGDILFILWPDHYELPILIFSISHLLYSIHFGSGKLYRMYLVLLILFVMIAEGLMNLMILYTLIILSNLCWAILHSNPAKVKGYILFVLSDALIGIREYYVRFPGDHFIALSLYFYAQHMLNY